MLLSMQNVFDDEGNLKIRGLTVDDLNGFASDGERDGQIILRKISSFLKERNIPEDKTKEMLNSFNIIAFNPQRDIPIKLDAEVSKLLKTQSSINKQIFTFIYENILQPLSISELKIWVGELALMLNLYQI